MERVFLAQTVCQVRELAFVSKGTIKLTKKINKGAKEMTSLEWIYIKTNCLSRINRNLEAGHFQDLKTRSKDLAKNKIKIKMG